MDRGDEFLAQPDPRLAVSGGLAGGDGQSVFQTPGLHPAHRRAAGIVLLQDLAEPGPKDDGVREDPLAFRLGQALQHIRRDQIRELPRKRTEAGFQKFLALPADGSLRSALCRTT